MCVLFLHENMYIGNSLEMPFLDTFNGYPQHTFWPRNMKNSILFVKKNTQLV